MLRSLNKCWQFLSTSNSRRRRRRRHRPKNLRRIQAKNVNAITKSNIIQDPLQLENKKLTEEELFEQLKKLAIEFLCCSNNRTSTNTIIHET